MSASDPTNTSGEQFIPIRKCTRIKTQVKDLITRNSKKNKQKNTVCCAHRSTDGQSLNRAKSKTTKQ